MKMGDDFLKYSMILTLQDYFKTFPFVTELEMVDERLKFHLPFGKLDWFQFIAEHKKLFDKHQIKWYAYDMDDGFQIELY